MPACDAGDPGSIPGRGKLNALDNKINKEFLCNGWEHYVPYRWLVISNKLCDSTLCTCGGVGGWEEQVHNVDYDPVKTVWGGEQREQRKSKRERGDVYTTRVQMALTLAV